MGWKVIIAPSTQSDVRDIDPLQLSLLNDYLYCPRRAALKIVEGCRSANEHTNRGDIVHENADLAGYQSQISNDKSQITWWRALPVWSERLGLNGKCDIVEVVGPVDDLKSENSDLRSRVSLRPVEFKLGKRRQWDNDDAQLCAQALCLEEMFGIAIQGGAVFHADSKRRREVEFTAELRASTERAIAELHALMAPSTRNPQLPRAVFKPACEECSLFDTCLPRITDGSAAAVRAAKQLFEI